jgi:predicted nucleic acid-binding protein
LKKQRRKIPNAGMRAANKDKDNTRVVGSQHNSMSSAGLTLDTGALIALESKERRMRAAVDAMVEHGKPVTVPSAVLVEWWRSPILLFEGADGDRARNQQRILAGMIVEPLSEHIAKVAGRAAGEVNASAVDAIVMASAALRGDGVFTSDIGDLQRLQNVFPSVRLFRTTGA